MYSGRTEYYERYEITHAFHVLFFCCLKTVFRDQNDSDGCKCKTKNF